MASFEAILADCLSFGPVDREAAVTEPCLQCGQPSLTFTPPQCPISLYDPVQCVRDPAHLISSRVTCCPRMPLSPPKSPLCPKRNGDWGWKMGLCPCGANYRRMDRFAVTSTSPPPTLSPQLATSVTLVWIDLPAILAVKYIYYASRPAPLLQLLPELFVANAVELSMRHQRLTNHNTHAHTQPIQ